MPSLTDTLGIHHPIVCAPMAGAAGGRLAHAVSSAGGLGMIGARGSASPEWIAEQATITSLRREKDDATEVSAGYECGMVLSYPDIQVDDIIEAYEMVEVPRD